MRRAGLASVIVTTVVASACSTQVSEIRTNSGGTLDCPSDTILYAMIDPVPGAAAQSPADALTLVGDDLVLPGIPEVESDSASEVVFLYRDAEGHRQGRVIIEQREGAGWLPTQTERCG